MAGRKVFTAGEVLQAADVNDYLMDQSVMVFAGTAARGSAIPSPTEGMVTYRSDDDTVEVFDGSAFVPVGSEPGLVEVKSALFTGTQTASLAGGATVAVTDLSIVHAVADSSNKLIISAFFGAVGNDVGEAGVGLLINDGSGFINIGATAGDRSEISAGGRTETSDNQATVTMPSVTFVYSPGAGSKTYTVHALNIDSASRTIYVNRTESDSDGAFSQRTVSSLVIQEVSV